MTRRSVSFILTGSLLAGCGLQAAPHALPRAAPAPAAAGAPRVAAENFARVDERLFRSGVPSDADMAALARLGVKTDISLQQGTGKEGAMVAHERAVAEKHGIRFVHIPLPFGKQPPADMVKRFLAVFADREALPALVHCKRGRDRTGAMVGLYRIAVNGWSNEKAFAEMKSFGFVPADYPYYAEFVQTWGARRRQREADAPVAFPVLGGWDAE